MGHGECLSLLARSRPSVLGSVEDWLRTCGSAGHLRAGTQREHEAVLSRADCNGMLYLLPSCFSEHVHLFGYHLARTELQRTDVGDIN